MAVLGQNVEAKSWFVSSHDFSKHPHMPPSISSPLVKITAPTSIDVDDFLAAVSRSRSLHADWVTPPATAEAYARYLKRTARDDFAAFFVRRIDNDGLAGVVNISHIIPEPLSSAFAGFYAFEPHIRRGYMHAGLQLALAHAFQTLGLHRLEANVQPANTASIALVQKLGFRREGFSPRYLKIAGAWRDHERWALLADEFTAEATATAP